MEENQEIVVTLHNGVDLKESSLSSKMKPYAVIYIKGYPGKLKSFTDEKHGSNPVWDVAFKFKFQPPLPIDAVLVFKIKHRSSTKIDRRMGKARIPLKFFSDAEFSNRVSHDVRLSNGEDMGRIYISYKRNIISPSTPPANVPAIEISNERPRPSRFSFETFKGLAGCFTVVLGVIELISGGCNCS